MKTLFHTDPRVVKEFATVQSPVKVCMHVLKAARNDSRVMREATTLVETGFAVSIIDVEGKFNQPSEEEIQGVCLKHVFMPDSFTTTRFTRWAVIRMAQLLVRSLLRLIWTSADVYHAHDLTALPACYIAARLRHKPLIFDAHELPLAELSINWSWLPAVLKRLLSHIISRCAAVITVSPPIAQEISSCYHSPQVSLVRNIPVYRAVAKSDLLRQYLGLNPGTRIALYQGVLHRNRELDRLVRAAAYLEQDTVIVMMGQNIGEIQPQLETLITNEGVGDRVRIIPPVPYEELLDWTVSADIGLIIYSSDYSLNIRMCLPNKLFEFLTAGLPVLASPLDAVADIISTYDVGQIVTSLAPADIGAAINSMLADHMALANMRRNALDASKEELSWDKESQQLIRLYHEILGMNTDLN